MNSNPEVQAGVTSFFRRVTQTKLTKMQFIRICIMLPLVMLTK